MAVVLHMRVCSTCEEHPQYLEGTPKVSMRVWAVSLRHTQSTHEGNYIHFPLIKRHSWVLWVCLKGTAHAHVYFRCASWVLHTLMSTAHTLCKVTLDPLCTDKCYTIQHSNLSKLSNQWSLIHRKTSHHAITSLQFNVVFCVCGSHSGPRGLLLTLKCFACFFLYSISLRPCRKLFGHHRNIAVF